MEQRVWHRSYDEGVPHDLAIEPIPLSAWVGRAAAAFPDRAALVCLNARLSYAQLAEEVARMATALAGLGVTKGSRVAIQMPNLPQLVIAYHAAMRLGAVVVMTNPIYTAYEVEQQWNDAGVDVALVMDFTYEQKLAPIRDRLPVQQVKDPESELQASEMLAMIDDAITGLPHPYRAVVLLKLRNGLMSSITHAARP